MKIGAFNIDEPIPKFKKPHAIAVLHPWIDAGNVGTLVLSRLEANLGARELGKLVRPGNFFDFTRYRPVLYSREGELRVVVPNTLVTYARYEKENDFVFLHLMEPHMLAEMYVESVLLLMKRLGVNRYWLIGSMYDYVPHSRPLIVTGRAFGRAAKKELREMGVQESSYEGPITITYLIAQQAAELGIEAMTMVVHLPQYTQLDDDYMGQVRLMQVICSSYDFPMDKDDVRKAEEQKEQIDTVVEKNPEMKAVVKQLEAYYDTRMANRLQEKTPKLSREVESFLKEMERRFRAE